MYEYEANERANDYFVKRPRVRPPRSGFVRNGRAPDTNFYDIVEKLRGLRAEFGKCYSRERRMFRFVRAYRIRRPFRTGQLARIEPNRFLARCGFPDFVGPRGRFRNTAFYTG